MSETENKLDKLIPPNKRLKIIFTAGILGIFLIFLSGLDFTAKEEIYPKQGQPLSNQEYIEKMENKLEQVLTRIKGVGTVQIMMTVEQGAEYIYASEDKVGTDRYQDYDGNQPKKVQTKTTTENNYILVDDSRGNAQPVIKTQIEPTIKGVMVVCDGAGDAVVCGRVTEALTTVLGIGANQVCIVPSDT